MLQLLQENIISFWFLYNNLKNINKKIKNITNTNYKKIKIRTKRMV
jgi:hypothetical protein